MVSMTDALLYSAAVLRHDEMKKKIILGRDLPFLRKCLEKLTFAVSSFEAWLFSGTNISEKEPMLFCVRKEELYLCFYFVLGLKSKKEEEQASKVVGGYVLCGVMHLHQYH
ncbi:hypothetical protein H1C71_004155 [Ictidomys tridecemlineatus]|nr:hypothetical protein H1C71_004155 [Ictidomys tridecemlineatus]KAG3277446.1 hypothetical protein H1C71_004155 [Ictidomys tridecemlineatus]KAG3277447.1 hypothetical protein H1C71_004155 [Ictidomys tridecemlineatus]KAG3277448.1 hypothetical protein H1C71_004155 [Ictidomys tridecemlineatus]KAG3277449.1 hypothetical protein H1C71_004155 [Ictidomys tridecemlineatus]